MTSSPCPDRNPTIIYEISKKNKTNLTSVSIQNNTLNPKTTLSPTTFLRKISKISVANSLKTYTNTTKHTPITKIFTHHTNQPTTTISLINTKNLNSFSQNTLNPFKTLQKLKNPSPSPRRNLKKHPKNFKKLHVSPISTTPTKHLNPYKTTISHL